MFHRIGDHRVLMCVLIAVSVIASLTLIGVANANEAGDRTDEAEAEVKDKGLAIQAELVEAKLSDSLENRKYYVGDEVALEVRLRNGGDSRLRILNWESECYVNAWRVRLSALNRPGQHFERAWSGLQFKGPRSARGPKWDSDFRWLEAGAETRSLFWKCRPFVPGRHELLVHFSMKDMSVLNGRGKVVTVPDAYTGQIWTRVLFEVSEEMSSDMKERYAKDRGVLFDEATAVEKRIDVLKDIADEGHYFAAMFINDIYKTSTSSEIKEAALKELARLFAYGTAYQLINEMADLMGDSAVPYEVRQSILRTFAQSMYRLPQHLVFQVAGQGEFISSKTQHTNFFEVVNKLRDDTDPRIALLAQRILDTTKVRSIEPVDHGIHSKFVPGEIVVNGGGKEVSEKSGSSKPEGGNENE